MRRPLGLPLAVSIAGHCCILLALIVFLGRIPLRPLQLAPHKEGIEITLAPAPPPAPPKPAPPPPPIPELPPPPPPSVVRTVPPPPPPRHERPVVVRPPPPRPRLERERPPQRIEREMPQYPPPPTQYVPPPREYAPSPPPVAAIPRPAPAPPRPAAPMVSAGYRAELSAWLAGHKRYPESARESGEQGEALLRFRVDRSGRVLSSQIVRSTGYPDLDAAVDAMMRGAVLPPFPPDMTADSVAVTVGVRFSLVQ